MPVLFRARNTASRTAEYWPGTKPCGHRNSKCHFVRQSPLSCTKHVLKSTFGAPLALIFSFDAPRARLLKNTAFHLPVATWNAVYNVVVCLFPAVNLDVADAGGIVFAWVVYYDFCISGLGCRKIYIGYVVGIFSLFVDQSPVLHVLA